MANTAAIFLAAATAATDIDADQELLTAVAGGDVASLGLLFDRHGQACKWCAYRLTADRRHADDVVVAVFVELWRRPTVAQAAGGGVGSWLLESTMVHCQQPSGSSTSQQTAL